MLCVKDANEFFSEVKAGNVMGFSLISPEGKNLTMVGTGSSEDISSANAVTAGDGRVINVTLKTTEGALLYVSSSSTSDTTQTITVTGLDYNFNEVTDSVKLVGRTKTAIGTTLFYRVNSVVLDAAAAGTVFVYYTSTPTNGVPADKAKVQAEIVIGQTQAFLGAYTVPNGKLARVYNVTYESYNAATATGTIVNLELVDGDVTTSYVIARYSDPGAGQLSFFSNPIEATAGVTIKLTSILANTGTSQRITASMDIVLEDVDVTAATVDVMTKAAYDAYLAAGGPLTLASTALYLIGLDEYPAITPTTIDLNDLLTPAITGTTAYKVASTITISFSMGFYSTDRLIQTSKKAIFCVWKCTDSGGGIKYVVAPNTPLINLAKVMSVTFAG